MTPARIIMVWLVVLCVIPAISGVSSAQSDPPAQFAEIELNVRQIGPGNAARIGSWTGLLVEVTDRSGAAREVVLRVVGYDEDGDTPYYERSVTTDAGRTRSYWVYLPLSHALSGERVIEVRVHEAIEADQGGEIRVGRQLGELLVDITGLVPATSGLAAVVGPWDLGLGQYAFADANDEWSPKANELLRVVSGVGVDVLPDRWQGLEAFSVIVWSGAGGRYDPGALSLDKARAIRSWVRRGGHLVVVMPSNDAVWMDRTGNPLADMLPVIRPPTRAQGIDLERYRVLLTSDADAPLPKNVVVHHFQREAEASVLDATPILNGPGGETVVMQRVLGVGMVTLVGIDLSNPRLRDVGLPEAEMFWHRVLGRRGEILSRAELSELANSNPQEAASIRNRQVREFHTEVGREIGKTGRAAAGVLLGLVLFVTYWVVAAPGVMIGLKQLGRPQHAWVVFVGLVGLFTMIAWGGAWVIKPKEIDARHLTMMNTVYGSPVSAGRTYASVLVPGYGMASFQVGEGGDDLISPWAAPGDDLGTAGFPDNRGYRVESRSPAVFEAPSRATVKRVRADWFRETSWGYMRPIGQPGDLEAPRLELVDMDAPASERPSWQVRGELIHDLPGALSDVVILVNMGQASLREASSGPRLLANAWAYKLTEPWGPELRLDMALVTRAERPSDRVLASRYLRDLRNIGRSVSLTEVGTTQSSRLEDRLIGLSLLTQLDTLPRSSQRYDVAQRALGHGRDIGVWLTRPCVIVIGFVRNDEAMERSPIDLRVNDEPAAMSGVTMVTWVYPFEGDPPVRMDDE